MRPTFLRYTKNNGLSVKKNDNNIGLAKRLHPILIISLSGRIFFTDTVGKKIITPDNKISY